MDELFQDKYRIPSPRLAPHDYGGTGEYFITICVDGRRPVFGELVKGSVRLNALGEVAKNFWSGIPQHYPNMSVDEFIIMPDHMHGIISLNQIVDAPRRLANTGPRDGG